MRTRIVTWWLKRITIEQWRAIDAETERGPGEAGTTSLTVLTVLVTAAVSLTLPEYLGRSDTYVRWFPPDGSRYWELRSLAWWSAWRVIGFAIVPMIVLSFLPGLRIRDCYVPPRGFCRNLRIYVTLFCATLPALLVASTTDAFRQTYPFYRLANRSYADLLIWEALYGIQFVALEFFFRGFMLQGLRRALGANAIFVMLVPYCMVHYGMPLAETVGAIGAGVILGTLAMRTRSIWGGVAVHISIASTMDLLALRGAPASVITLLTNTLVR